MSKRTSKERYYWLKEHRICVSCGHRDAERNSVYCFICREKVRISKRKNYERMKRKDKLFAIRQAERSRNNYVKAKSAGKCPRCGKVLPGNSHTVCCTKCLRRLKNKYRPKDYYSRAERPNYGRCYICGKFELYSEKLCKECYEKLIKRSKGLRENPTPAMLKTRENMRRTSRIFFQSKK